MKKYIPLIVSILSLLVNCTTHAQTLNNFESEILKVERINDHIFKHTSFLETNSGVFPSNGMIYVNKNEAIIFDTPVTNEASAELIDWLRNTKVKAIIVTHFHIDCLGGLNAFHSHGIKSYATNRTIALAKEDKRTLPENGFDNSIEFNVGDGIVYAKYFGEGHTVDNIIGYVPTEKALFGGCLVKEVNAYKGNLNDANVTDWAKTVDKIITDIPEIEIVIPGHGDHGGIELLHYTSQLFEER